MGGILLICPLPTANIIKMNTPPKCDLSVSQEEIHNAKVSGPAFEALCEKARQTIAAGGKICILGYDDRVDRVLTTKEELEIFCSLNTK